MNTDSNEEMICGLNAISQIIKTRPKSVKILFVIDSPNERLKELIQLTEEQNIKVEKQNASFFDRNFEGINHQNVALRCNKRSEETENYLELILEKKKLNFLF
jgi:tRNA G18 (ribose-2'-O)-methylase SpoU